MPKGLHFQINPRGLRVDTAAAYLGMGKTKFLELVNKGIAKLSPSSRCTETTLRRGVDKGFAVTPR
jgi:hypothetical protein